MRRFKAALVFISLVFNPLFVYAETTPSHVYQLAHQITYEIEHLRNNSGVTGSPRIPDVQVNKSPLHVYAKSLELLEKVARIQRDNGIPALIANRIPLRKISPADVYQQAELILQEIAKIQDRTNSGKSSKTAQFEPGKSPSNVYEVMWRSSFMLDALTQKLSPTDVFNNMYKANTELEDLAQQTAVQYSKKKPQTNPKTKPSQVLLQGYLNLHKLRILEQKLGLMPVRVPTLPKGKLTPSDVYDSVSMFRAEIARIKIHLKLKENFQPITLQTGKKPSDVLAIMKQAQNNIDVMINAN